MNYSDIIEKGLDEIGKLDETSSLPFEKWFEGTGGLCETSKTLKNNVEFFEKLNFKMRVIDSVYSETSTEIFGHQINTPIMTGCMSNGGNGILELRENAFSLVGKAMSKIGSIAMMGMGSEKDLRATMEECENVVKITKPYKEDKVIIDKISRAEELGVIAVGIDVDFGLGAKFGDEVFRKKGMEPKKVDKLKDIISTVDVPFIAKGILSKRDARKAREAGAEAIVVSNHHGAVLDHAAHPLQLLPEIREEVGDDLTILADSGFRRGTDVLKGLALGADGVLLGISTVVGLAADGAEGVERLFKIITEELARAMSLTGCSTINEVNEDIMAEK